MAAWLTVTLLALSLPVKSVAQATARDDREVLPEAPSSGWNAPDERASPASRGVTLLKRFAGDQSAIWTSPLRLRRTDAIWALPALAGTGVLLASDSWFAKQIPAGEIKRSRSLSNYGAFALAGGAGGMFLFGKMTNNDHAAETGFLAGEAAVNAAALDFALKNMFQRPRPYQGSGAGHFFAGGASFPSEHAAVSWAIAGVVAHEYPGPVTRWVSYGLATAVTVARVTGKEHFPSDVVVGGALGYFIARQIYQRRRDPEISAAAWETPVEKNLQNESQDKVRSPRNMGSSYVPPDSWVYPLFERLAAMGYIHSAYLGMRPWTRMQCARFLEEVGESMRYQVDNGAGDGFGSDDASGGQAVKLYTALSNEFAEETERLDGGANLGVRLDSVYERTTSISGPPLTDGFHFAQTLINDYGRPYAQGFSAISGVAGHADAGMLSFSFQGEYQHAPAIASYSSAVQQTISVTDQVLPFANGTAQINRLQVVNSSVALAYHDLQFSFGKQAQWLGPGSGPFLASTNAPSIVMFQMSNVVPWRVPLLSDLLGPARSVFFVGQLTGQTFVYDSPNIVGPGFHPQPFVHGNKVSFKPTANLEFGMGLTAIFAGPGLPFTFSEFFRSYYSHKASVAQNPAKRFSGFDISYRVPGLRKWLTFYNDSLVGDEISPIGSSRPLLSPGLYLPQVPKIPNLELRFEGEKDPFDSGFLPGFNYYDRRFRSGYTNGGNLIGNWAGRFGLGGLAEATYWLSPMTKLQCGYRYQEADHRFLEGGRLTDYSLRAETKLKSGFAVSAFLQYEQWKFPLLAASPQSNVTTSVQLSFYPRAWARH